MSYKLIFCTPGVCIVAQGIAEGNGAWMFYFVNVSYLVNKQIAGSLGLDCLHSECMSVILFVGRKTTCSTRGEYENEHEC